MTSHHLQETVELRAPTRGKRPTWLVLVLLAAIAGSGLWAYRSLYAAEAGTTDTHEARRLQVAALTPVEKEALARQQEQFNALSAAEQDRLRKLHADLTADPHGPQLMAVAVRYHEWLKTLSTGQRAELLDMPPAERIVRIEQLKRDEESRQFRELVDFELPQEDIDRIFTSVSTFIRDNESRIVANLSQRQQAWLNRIENEQMRTRTLFFLMLRQGPRESLPMPNEESVERLINSLTPATQQQIRNAETPEQKAELLRNWVWAAVISRTSPETATAEELEKFFAELPQERRERLESLPSDQMQHELRRLYYQEKFGFHHRGHRGGPGGPDRDGPGPGPPRWDGPPPHERGEGRPAEDRRRGEGRERESWDRSDERGDRPQRGEGPPPRRPAADGPPAEPATDSAE